MTGIILEMLADPDVLFVVVAALTLTIFIGFVAILLPDRFCGPWLSIMAPGATGVGWAFDFFWAIIA